MDSITQITLGAAVGEIVLGKKVGNRAMLWGGIAGTIPDLDILLNAVMDPINALAQHRGFSHSFVFAIISCWGFGWLVHKLYESETYKKPWYKGIVMIGALIALLFVSSFINAIFWAARGNIFIPSVVICLIASIYLMFRFYKNYFKGEPKEVNTTYKDWVLLFFWCIITHPILDSFTVYGTQLFQPFSDYRVGFDNISVVDPLYTMWYLLLIPALYINRKSILRQRFAIFALIFSTTYLVFTGFNKIRVNSVFKVSLNDRNLKVDRFMTGPTIANNLLWHCIAESDSVYYQGLYSINDKIPRLSRILAIPKRHHLIEEYKDDHIIETLRWFSNDYYNIEYLNEDTLQVNDMRFGMFSDKIPASKDYVFSFYLEPNGKELKFSNKNKGPGNEDRMLSDLWARMMGEVEFVDSVIVVR